jgi:hemoglobin
MPMQTTIGRPMNSSAPFQYRAANAGLSEPLVRRVVVSFYDKVRSDAVLGPVFAAAIGDDWSLHIERIVLFWLTATKLGRGYDGKNFMPTHLRHHVIQADQLPRWLDLFRDTANEQCPTQSASVLIDIAERMAETLSIGIARRDNE